VFFFFFKNFNPHALEVDLLIKRKIHKQFYT